jgi:hypothetical protein
MAFVTCSLTRICQTTECIFKKTATISETSGLVSKNYDTVCVISGVTLDSSQSHVRVLGSFSRSPYTASLN